MTQWTITEDLREYAYVLSDGAGRKAWFSLHDFRTPILPNRLGGIGVDPFAELAAQIEAGLRPFRVEGRIQFLPSRDQLLADLRAPVDGQNAGAK